MAGPPDPPVRHVAARDGVRLAWRELGGDAPGARPLLLIHGYASTARINWLKYGHAQRIADAGFRVVMPDLRGHGDSDRPHDPAAYRPDVLADDAEDLLGALGWSDYDLAGYSLGARTALRLMVRGARPRRAVLCGMGLEGVLRTAGRGDYFRHVLTNLGSFARGTPEWLTEAFLRTSGADPQALLLVLDTFHDTTREELSRVAVPTLVVTGADDRDNGPAEPLAAALPDAAFRAIPGNHMSAVTKPELGGAIADYLAAA